MDVLGWLRSLWGRTPLPTPEPGPEPEEFRARPMPEDMYSVLVRCSNCMWKCRIETKREEAIEMLTCPNCGCWGYLDSVWPMEDDAPPPLEDDDEDEPPHREHVHA